ncbi:tachykinin-like peptides receptor 86C isoform X3 [Daktulosphaira vitifoliae]|uniref:tachykinin-like peptides receptor 86C isoform X1 n=1 Tax=Daktulosphaira vitifoliae TaxID=58002 RepID=UPI0021A98E32|nr:tachykinin-like peptides receptor 86C isoform X1 [Daktulosphaira vitifoliae]XP_050536874.1 tachykinin-like peptides receptor 86C isoform X2 [Daktulosphaira vitifoliae]XP_050536875.1 tachykinin-like peptides receptor 86C isoform X3 [Daktulosphaira vitifoliae]
MEDRVNENLLRNCTMMVLSIEFGQSTSELESSNSSTLLGILGTTLNTAELTMPKRTMAKDRLHDCIYPISEPSHSFSWWHKLTWITLFIAMLTVAILGNLIVIWIVAAHRRMRTVTNCYMVSLSVSDLFMASLNCLPNFIYMLNSDWPFGLELCIASNFIAYWTVASSVFTLVSITLNRYMAIVHPLRHRRSRTRTQTVLILIWAISIFLAIPCFLYSNIKTKRYTNGELRRACYMLWPDGRYPHSKTEYIYNILFLFVTYIIPLVVMFVCYTIMGKELWGSKSIGQMTERHEESIKSKRKVVRMFAVVVAIFIICWLPYHFYFVYAYHNKDIVSKAYVQDLFLAFYWLAMSNSMVNPIIYYWMNPRFRTYFKAVLCFCTCLRKSERNSNDLNVIRVNGDSSHYFLTRSKSGPASLGVQRLRQPQEVQVLCLVGEFNEVAHQPKMLNLQCKNHTEIGVLESDNVNYKSCNYNQLQNTKSHSTTMLILSSTVL